MVVYVRQPSSKTARATRVALTPRTRQVKVEGHGAMSKRRHDDIVVTCMNNKISSSIVRFPCSCWSLMPETLLGIIAVRQRFEIGVDAA